MALGAWFGDGSYFAQQKLLQMKVLGDTIPDGDTPLAQLQAAIDAYNTANGTNVTVESNFEACNMSGYVASIPANAVNVSPNALFNIPYYLTAAAKYANESGYTAEGVSAPWTAQSVLEHMQSGGYSAWAHFMGAGLDQQLDCSAEFSTSKYLAAKAQATGQTVDQVIAAMKAAQLNPVMDYYENGRELGIDLADLAVDTDNVLTPEMADGAQWGALAPGDGYDDVAAYVPIDELGNTGPYVGDNGVNTQFDAKHVIAAGQSTLNANDVISGGSNAMNTLAVEINKDWSGFNGVAPEGVDFVMPGDYLPNVTGVGRVKLDRAVLSSEQAITFDAKNISSDTVQYDLNASGTGTTSLKNLSDAVARINVTDLVKGTEGTQTTKLDFVADANSGKADTLTIGVDNVFAGSGQHKIVGTGVDLFENLVVDAMGGKSGVDVSAFTGAKVISITGAGDVRVAADLGTDKVKTLDASQATGDVNFMLTGAATNTQTITGGSGNDTVTIVDGTAADATFKGANWSSIETVAFSSTSDVTIHAKGGAEGLNTFWVNNTGAYKVDNLNASDVTVYQQVAETSKATTINGGKNGDGLGNITWVSAGTNDDYPDGQAIKANLLSSAKGAATIDLTQEDTLATGSIFNFTQATSVKLNSPNATTVATEVTLQAPKATKVDLAIDGGLKLVAGTAEDGTDLGPSALAAVQTLLVNLTNESTGNTPDQFDMSAYTLKGLQQGTVNADGEDIVLGAIGKLDKGPGFNLTINDANTATVGTMQAGLGNNVQVQISADDLVTLGAIETKTNQNVNDQGDVTVAVTTDGDVQVASVTGGQINLNFTGVEGNADSDGGATAFEISAQERIIYQGAYGDDAIKVTRVGKGTTSLLQLGDGDDTVEIDLSAEAKFGDKGVATINLELGSGTDTVTVTTGAATGILRVNISDYESGDTIDVSALTGVTVNDGTSTESLVARADEPPADGDEGTEGDGEEGGEGEGSEGGLSVADFQALLRQAGLSTSLANLTWEDGKAYDANSETAYFMSEDAVIVVAGVASTDCFGGGAA